MKKMTQKSKTVSVGLGGCCGLYKSLTGLSEFAMVAFGVTANNHHILRRVFFQALFLHHICTD